MARSAKLGVTLMAFALLSGCGLCGCMSDDTPVGQNFTYNGNAWRVSDERAQGRLVIVAVDPRLAGLGTEAAARHAVSVMPEAEYRAAANGWFTTGGRFCTPGPAEQADPGYSYQYSCWVPG